MKLSTFRPHSLEAILMHHCSLGTTTVGEVNASSIQRGNGNEVEYLDNEVEVLEVELKTKSLTNVNYSCLGLQVNSFHKECLKSKISGVLWEI